MALHPVYVYVIGASGLIGNEVVKMLVDLTDDRVFLRGICDSKQALYLTHPCFIPGWKANKDVRWRVSDFSSFEGAEVMSKYDGSSAALLSFTVEDVPASHHIVIVDCTASEIPSSLYGVWLNEGCHVVTANKKVNSGDLAYYLECCAVSNSVDMGGMWFTEATCGAGLPVIKTIRSLVQTGDSIETIRGVFSGTMSFLFNTWKPSSPFSAVVDLAKTNGYTEPDPRQDLNGLDVARKVVILARECGLDMSLEDVSVEGLVPDSLTQCTVDEFLAAYPSHDDAISARAFDAARRNCVLRFLGSVDVAKKTVTVGIAEVDASHPFALLTGADNILEITSARYGPSGGSTPMVIRGPGAGAAVTAAGVVGDVLDLLRLLPRDKCH